MHPQDLGRTLGQGERRHGHGPHHPFGSVASGDLPEEALAGDTEHHRYAKDLELIQFPKLLHGVRKGLAEADAGVDTQGVGIHTGMAQVPQSHAEELHDFLGDVDVVRIELHRGGVALHVHQHQAGLVLQHNVQHSRVTPQGGDIVDDAGPGFQALPGHFGLHRVH